MWAWQSMIMVSETIQLVVSNATKAPVAGGVVGKIRDAGRTTVAVAVTMVAKERTPFGHLSLFEVCFDRILFWATGLVVDAPSVLAPFPNVPNHVAQAEVIGGEYMSRGG